MFAWVSSWNSSWRTSPLPNKWYSPFHQCGQTNECASKLECINKLFLCLSFFFFSCLCSFFRWLSRLLTQKSWEDLHHKWPMTMGIWLSRAEWPQLQQNQRRSAVFRPLYSLYTVASTWVFFYCRECNKFRAKGQGAFTSLGCSTMLAAIAKCDTFLVWSDSQQISNHWVMCFLSNIFAMILKQMQWMCLHCLCFLSHFCMWALSVPRVSDRPTDALPLAQRHSEHGTGQCICSQKSLIWPPIAWWKVWHELSQHCKHILAV